MRKLKSWLHTTGKPTLFLWFILGSLYLTIEILWRGHTDRTMLIVGGLCGILIGTINQHERFYKLKIVWQSLIGTAIVLVVEFIAGCILNFWLGLGIWDYTGMPGNVLGQICLPYGFLWFMLMPLAIWLEDELQWVIYNRRKRINPLYDGKEPEIKLYSIVSIYTDLIMGR